MKKLLLLAVAVVFTTSLFAQQKGDVVVSGTFGFQTTSNKTKVGSTSTKEKGDRSFQLMPEIRYFFDDNFSAGLGIGYSLLKSPNGNGDDGDELFDKMGLFMLEPHVGYHLELSSKFYYTPRFYVGFGFGKYKSEEGGGTSSESNVSTINIGLSVLSFEFKPCEKIGMLFSAGNLEYSMLSEKIDDYKDKSKSFGLNLNMGATIGFNYYF